MIISNFFTFTNQTHVLKRFFNEIETFSSVVRFYKRENHVFQVVCTCIKRKNTFLKFFSFLQENGGCKLMNSVMMKIKNVKLVVADLATSKFLQYLDRRH